MNALFEKLDRGLTGIRLYGIAPPKRATDAERLREIAGQQITRVRMLAPDGLVVYDIQDEPGRSDEDLCESVFTDVQDYAREKHLPIGINVESVSIRKSEVEASVELFRRLSSRLGR